MKILVLGGAGYSGSVLVGELLARGDKVTVVDNFWFGDWLGESPNLTKVIADVRNPDLFPREFFDSLIHLANIANDQGVEMSPVLSWEVNVLASQHIAEWAIARGIPHLVYASSGSVYGVKNEERVTEDLDLVPISTYNKTKMVSERVFLSYSHLIRVHIVRPATICGLSPRLRLDLTVNLLVHQAVSKREITVFGGSQVRPNIHVDDLVTAYIHFLDQPAIEPGVYNAGFENLAVLKIAEMISLHTGAEITVMPSNDPRSYRVDSTKLSDTGFLPLKGVAGAIEELAAFFSSGNFRDSEDWYTVAKMKSLGLKGIQ